MKFKLLTLLYKVIQTNKNKTIKDNIKRIKIIQNVTVLLNKS